ncbi:hypothetical protein AVEN_156414-1 [Araneus ventricosus]|uniref:Uncharacterized protein n=1 Tax=Araneus ventricosus TaxID=182803 RepID=A0A4Y2QWP3_ARAVE|nr:hypothetical protein AVEN_156414-1 [Araneus ventricosus]
MSASTCYQQAQSHIAILVCRKLAADLHCKSASSQQVSHDKSASVKQVCSKLTQASKSPWDELAARLHCKHIAKYSKNKVRTQPGIELAIYRFQSTRANHSAS